MPKPIREYIDKQKLSEWPYTARADSVGTMAACAAKTKEEPR